jgi:ribosomal protein S14
MNEKEKAKREFSIMGSKVNGIARKRTEDKYKDKQRCSNCGKLIPSKINRDFGVCPFCLHRPSVTPIMLPRDFWKDKNKMIVNKKYAKRCK